MKLTAADNAKLKGVHPDLVKVVRRAAELSDITFRVTCGLRTVAEQKVLVAKGASKTMNSRHLTGHAVDIVPFLNGKPSWDWPVYHKLAVFFKQAAKELKVPLEWGGDWKSFKDGPHWQLPWASYPKISNSVNLTTEQEVAAYGEDVHGTPPYTNETETAANTKALASVAGGVGSGAVVAAQPIMDAVNTLTSQQGEITSGSLLRIAIAVVIVGAAVWFAYKKLKGDNGEGAEQRGYRE